LLLTEKIHIPKRKKNKKVDEFRYVLALNASDGYTLTINVDKLILINLEKKEQKKKR